MLYEDGDIEEGVLLTNVRKAAKKVGLVGAEVGMEVKGFFQNRHWHPAVITAVNEDGTCNIKYHDGVEEENYGAKRLAIVLSVEADDEDLAALSKPVATKKKKVDKKRTSPTVLPGRAKSRRKRTPTKRDGE